MRSSYSNKNIVLNNIHIFVCIHIFVFICIFLTPKIISAFLVPISLRSPYAEGTVIILLHIRRKTDAKFVKNDICQ